MTGKLFPQITDSFFNNFEIICHKILIKAYNDAIADMKYSVEWDEDQFTDYLIIFMSRNSLTKNHQIFIKPRSERDKITVPVNEDHPKYAVKIDIWLGSWISGSQFNYYMEAKNLSETDWKKSSGAGVSSSYYFYRYIDTGINNFITQRYSDGCLVGYIVHGSPEKIISELNNRIQKRRNNSETLKKSNFIDGYSLCYLSTHQTNNSSLIALKHILLKF